MTMIRLSLICMYLCTTLNVYCIGSKTNVLQSSDNPLVIAHRGASGMIPEHTAHAYQLAIDQGAEVIECDVTITQDLVLVCIHQNWLKEITDVEEKFPERNSTTRFIDDKNELIEDDYFAIDFTYAELETLRVHQRYSYRDPTYDGEYKIHTFDEFLTIIEVSPRTVAIYPETKDPEWTNSEPPLVDAGVTIEELVIKALEERGYVEPDGRCFVQTFGKDSIERLRELTNLPLVRLSNDMFSDDDLDDLGAFAYGIGVNKELLVDVDPATNYITEITNLTDRAHARGLKVHTYTMRNENEYLAFDYGQDPHEEYRLFMSLNVDGMFTDFPSTLVRFLEWNTCKDTTDKSNANVSRVHPVVFIYSQCCALIIYFAYGQML